MGLRIMLTHLDVYSSPCIALSEGRGIINAVKCSVCLQAWETKRFTFSEVHLNNELKYL